MTNRKTHNKSTWATFLNTIKKNVTHQLQVTKPISNQIFRYNASPKVRINKSEQRAQTIALCQRSIWEIFLVATFLRNLLQYRISRPWKLCWTNIVYTMGFARSCVAINLSNNDVWPRISCYSSCRRKEWYVYRLQGSLKGMFGTFGFGCHNWWWALWPRTESFKLNNARRVSDDLVYGERQRVLCVLRIAVIIYNVNHEVVDRVNMPTIARIAIEIDFPSKPIETRCIDKGVGQTWDTSNVLLTWRLFMDAQHSI